MVISPPSSRTNGAGCPAEAYESVRATVEYADEGRNERIRMLGLQRAICGVEHRDRIWVNLRHAADHLSHRRHYHGGGETRARDVPYRNDDPPVAEAQGVVPIAAEQLAIVRGDIDAAEAHPGNLRERNWKRRALKFRRNLALSLVKARVLDRHGRALRELLEQR